MYIGVKGVGQEDLSTISEQDEVSIAENFIKYGVGAFFGGIGLSPAVMGWATSCDDRP